MTQYSIADIEQIRNKMQPLQVDLEPISALINKCPGAKRLRARVQVDSKSKIIQLANKLSASTLDDTKRAMCRVLEEDGFSVPLVKTLIGTLSSSRLVSELGSVVCAHSVPLSPVLESEVAVFIDDFYTSVEALSPHSASLTYDELCAVNKANDSNISRAQFVVNLQLALGHDIVCIRSQINKVMDCLVQRAASPGMESVCMHITELLYTLLAARDGVLIDECIRDRLKTLDLKWVESTESAQAKTAFRVMDILDIC